ncbi:hypothetical protein O0L34_g15927 [Tuta absoluta]|nr:hypothetical protein O0L34_g15927 [Tuta absoluta]
MAAPAFFVIFLTIISSVVAKPSSDGTDIGSPYKKEHCIRVTPKREAEIQEIMNKISDYIEELAMDHQYFDIRLLKFAIERHTPHETEDKDVQIQVTINDCEESFEPNGHSVDSHENLDTLTANQNSDTHSQTPLVQPQLIRLDLDQNGQELVETLQKRRGKKRPLLVYIQSGKEHYFLRR